MITPASGGLLGLVELARVDELLLAYGADSFNEIRDAFLQRMNSWARKDDQCKALDNNRMCVILKGMSSRAELELATSKLSRVFDEPHRLFNQWVSMDVSAGFVAIEGADPNIDRAISRAGKALSLAKKTNRFYEVYNPESEEETVDEYALVAQLQAAVEQGEFELYFQPKLHAGFRTVLGAEALMRWHTKDRKVRGPDEFIEVAERHTVIRSMTWWAIKSAVSRLSRWPEELSISVNITPTLLLDDEIIAVVQDALEIHMVKPERLTLEVLESVMVDNQELMLRQLSRLRMIGIKISIDDFGTGFSSLSYFRDLPADEIKIDKRFVIPMLSSGKDHAIVKSVIDLAHNFSLKVVAEGVEDKEIAQRLAELNCDILQGYAFDRPIRAAEFEKRYM